MGTVYAIKIEGKLLRKDYKLNKEFSSMTRIFSKRSNAERVKKYWWKEIKWILVNRLIIGMPKCSRIDISSEEFKNLEKEYFNLHKPEIVEIETTEKEK